MTFTKRGIKFNDERLCRLSLEVLDELEVLDLRPCKLESITLREQNNKFGCCHTKWYKATKEIVSNRITINRKFIEQNATDRAIKEVIAHEICHALKDCVDCAHDGKWAEYADLINDCYNMDIKQYGSYEKYGLERSDKKKYVCECKHCGGKVWKMGYRAPKWYSLTEKHIANGYYHKCTDGVHGALINAHIER